MVKIKKPPDYGQEATQMFSQQNNFYCDLLSRVNLIKKIKASNKSENKKANRNSISEKYLVIFLNNDFLFDASCTTLYD